MTVKGTQKHDTLVFQPYAHIGTYKGYDIEFKSIKNTQPMSEFYKELDAFTKLIKEHLDAHKD